MKQTMMEENPYRAMGEELVRLEREGKLPEGFDLEEACQDDKFLELLQELEPYGAIRVYAAEKAAENAKAAARGLAPEPAAPADPGEPGPGPGGRLRCHEPGSLPGPGKPTEKSPRIRRKSHEYHCQYRQQRLFQQNVL